MGSRPFLISMVVVGNSQPHTRDRDEAAWTRFVRAEACELPDMKYC
jgi:hypothetical protein